MIAAVTFLGIPEAKIHTLMSNLGHEKGDGRLAFAHIVWSCLTEPGDQSAALFSETLTPVRALELLASGIQANEVLSQMPHLERAFSDRFVDSGRTLAEAFERWRPRLDLDEIARMSLRHLQLGGQVLTPLDDFWPDSLKDLGLAAPFALWGHGRRDLLSTLGKSVSVVGSRVPSGYGEMVTSDFVSEFVANGLAILSGGAFGIDSIAHRSTLALGGTTVAILAGGSDRFYPTGNRAMLEQIRANGLIVTEMPPGAMPTKWRFLQRNRLVAAMSAGTVIVEAGWRSGSINTANHAESIGRPVFAVPGSVASPSSSGCHRLIREGRASLVASGQDVLQDLGFETSISALGALELTPTEKRAMDALTRRPRQFAEICREAGLTAQEAQSALGSLLLQGLATQDSDGWHL